MTRAIVILISVCVVGLWTSPDPAGGTPVPEPAVLTLLGVALAGLARARPRSGWR